VSAFNDLIGMEFGQLTVLALHHRGGKSSDGVIKKVTWLCRCSCGAEVLVRATNLMSGNSTSCGCYKAEALLKANTTHDLSHTATWASWASWNAMKLRCTDPRNNRYAHYKARGITMDPRWMSLENFYIDMGLRPSYAHSIERKDNDGPYCAWNCVWGTDEEQANNRSSNRIVELDGVKRTLAQWCRYLGMIYATVKARLDYGWTPEQAFSTPTDGQRHEKPA